MKSKTTITVRVDQKTKQALSRAAKNTDMTLSTFARNILDVWYEGHKHGAVLTVVVPTKPKDAA
jgi:hypothetical protein